MWKINVWFRSFWSLNDKHLSGCKMMKGIRAAFSFFVYFVRIVKMYKKTTNTTEQYIIWHWWRAPPLGSGGRHAGGWEGTTSGGPTDRGNKNWNERRAADWGPDRVGGGTSSSYLVQTSASFLGREGGFFYQAGAVFASRLIRLRSKTSISPPSNTNVPGWTAHLFTKKNPACFIQPELDRSWC